MQIQHAIGADIIMAFDQCAAYGAEPGEVARAVTRTGDRRSRAGRLHFDHIRTPVRQKPHRTWASTGNGEIENANV